MRPIRDGNNPCTYTYIVIGAGGVGCAAAYHLAKDLRAGSDDSAGAKVLLLEQFELGHTRGSSHGGSRIIRYTHDATSYARQMPQTFALWRALEQETGATLLQMSGGLYMGTPEQPFLVGAQAALAELGFAYDLLDASALRVRFPQFCIPEDWIALYQQETGILAATRCVQTLARQAVHFGAEVQERTRVTALRPLALGDGVEVATEGPAGTVVYRAQQVFLCAGPWASRFLAELLPQPIPLRVTHQQVVYYPVPDPAAYAPGRFPVFLCTGDEFVYGLPAWERPGQIKAALEQETKLGDPETAQRAVDPTMLESLNQAMARYFPEIDPTPAHAETCLYTETASRDFIIDHHPEHPQILIAAGFSGRGFKHTIAVGRLLADLAACPPGEYRSDFWLENYRIEHFMQPN